MSALAIECLLVFNDDDPVAIELLRANAEPLLAAAKEGGVKLHLHAEYMNRPFEEAYPVIKQLLGEGRYRNVLFNLDQYGYRQIDRSTVIDILNSFSSTEVFYTFAIQSLLAFLQKSDPERLAARLAFLGTTTEILGNLEAQMSKETWLGAAERLVFESFGPCAKFVSPFSIHNPEGWCYWLIHFANSHRARQEYNNVLHRNSSMQAHFGRSGLEMLCFDPSHDDNQLYLFDDSGREGARDQLTGDIPRLVTEFGDAIGVGEFYQTIYNMTPAHMDDIHEAMIDSPDLEIITEAGGERRKAKTIRPGDTLRLKRQRSFFPMFLGRTQGSEKN